MNRIFHFFIFIFIFPCICHSEADMAPASTAFYTFENNSVLYDPSRQEYLFRYNKDGEIVEYNVHTNDNFIKNGMISLRARVNEERTIIPLKRAGLLVRTATGEILSTTEITASGLIRFVTHYTDQGSAVFSYEETLGDRDLVKDYRFTIRGKTLIINASSHTVSNATTGYTGFDFGESLYTPNPEVMRFSTSPFPVMKSFDNIYLSCYVDPLLSTTARYDETAMVLNRRNAQVSNTPAWLIEGIYGSVPDLNVTAYVTLSTDWNDVLPQLPPSSQKNKVVTNFVLDMEGLPLAKRPYLPLETIRQWTAPDDGQVKLKGTVALLEGKHGVFEVRIKRAGKTKPFVMFSQLFNPSSKLESGLEGSFPVTQGDELLFVCSSHDVMDGGLFGMNIEFQFHGKHYSTLNNYSNQQGENGWFYKQQRGPFTSLLLWNNTAMRWESPDTRSWISQEAVASRRGAKGDAFLTAGLFLDEINALGLRGIQTGLRRWDIHTATTLDSLKENPSSYWGKADSLQKLSKQEILRGNQIVPHVSLSSLKDIVKPLALNHFLSTIMNWKVPTESEMVNFLDEAIHYRLHKLNTAMQYNGLWLEGLPHPEGTNRYISTLKWLDNQHDNQPAYVYADRLIKPRLEKLGVPIYWQGDFMAQPQHWFWNQFADGINTPAIHTSSNRMFLHPEVAMANQINRIGFGGMGHYFQPGSPNEYVDAQFNSMDAYLTSLMAERRVPYLSDQYTNASWTSRDIRLWLLESYALSAPVAAEYLDHAHRVSHIVYQTQDGTIVNATDALKTENSESLQRAIIHYSNGLRIYANRSGESWSVPESFLPVVSIKKDGFLAVNEHTGLTSITGILGGSEYSAARTVDSFFLHSRNGNLLDVSPIMTDGMVYIRNSPVKGKQDVTALSVSELNRTGTLQPIIRASQKVDAAIQWKSPDTVEIWMFDALPGKFLFEYYDLPPEWFNEDSSEVVVTRRWEHESESQEETAWSIVKDNGIHGIRFPSAQGGIIYQITHRNAQQTSMVK